MRLTIARKLGLGFGAILVATGGLGAAAYLGARDVQRGVDELAEMTTDLEVAGSAFDTLGDMRMAAQKVMRFKDEKSIRAFDAAKDNLRGSMDALDAAIQNPDRRAMLATMQQDIDAYVRDTVKVEHLLVEWRTTIEKTLHPMNVAMRADLIRLGGELDERMASGAFDEAEADAVAAFQAGVRDYLDGVIAVKFYFAMQDPEDAKLAGERLASATVKFREARGGIRDARVVERIDSAVGKIDSATAIFTELRAKQGEANRLAEQSLDVLGPKISKTADELTDSLVASADERKVAAATTVAKLNATLAIVTAAAVIVGVGLAFGIARSILRPVRSLAASLREIADGDGDLTARVNVKSTDEIGVLATNFNRFVENLHGIIGEVRSATESVAGASAEIAASAEEMATGLNQQEQQSQAVAAAVEEMSQSVREVARKSSDAASAATQSKGAAETGGSVVGQTVSEMRAIAEEVGSGAESVNALGRKGEQIGEIIAVINDIADQTNLLALNAAIEAARAGEHGRGFAVVADEVRKLAERTTEATEEVSRSIREIQTDTASAVEKMQSGSRRVASGVELASNAGTALREIVTSSEAMQEMVRGIAAAAEQQAGVSDEISRNVEQISAVTRQSSQGASQASEAAADLSRQADRLQNLVGRFKI